MAHAAALLFDKALLFKYLSTIYIQLLDDHLSLVKQIHIFLSNLLLIISFFGGFQKDFENKPDLVLKAFFPIHLNNNLCTYLFSLWK